MIWQARDWRLKFLVAMSAPIILLVLGQAVLSRAYANWAVTAYVAATVLTVPLLWTRARVILWLGLAVNMVVAAALPIVVTGADRWMARDGERLLLRRYVGRAETSDQIIGAAQITGQSVIVSRHRDLLADLTYAAHDLDIAVLAIPSGGAPEHYYEQEFPLPRDFMATVLYADFEPPGCADAEPTAIASGPAYRDATIWVTMLEPWCWEAE